MIFLITGGASGLGQSITQKLASNKNDIVYFTFNNSKGNAEEIEQKYNNTKSIQCDFRNDKDIGDLIKFIDNTPIDVLINNAFVSELNYQYFHKIDINVFLDNFRHNIIPTIKITQKIIINFKKRKFGKIINILSSGLINNPPLGLSEYVALKAYLESLSKSWAVENAKYNITSNSISPSFMLTNLTNNNDKRIIENIIEQHPLKTLLTPDEVSDAVMFLSKCSQQINGINMIINSAQ